MSETKEIEAGKARIQKSQVILADDGGIISVEFNYYNNVGVLANETRVIKSDAGFEELCVELKEKYSDFRHFYDDDDIKLLRTDYQQAALVQSPEVRKRYQPPAAKPQSTFYGNEDIADMEVEAEPEDEEETESVVEIGDKLDRKFGRFDNLKGDEITDFSDMPGDFSKNVFGGGQQESQAAMQYLGEGYIAWLDKQLRANILLEYALNGFCFDEILRLFRGDAPRIFGRRRYRRNLFILYCEAKRLTSVIKYVDVITGAMNPVETAAAKLYGVGYTDLLVALQTEAKMRQQPPAASQQPSDFSQAQAGF